MPAYFVARTYRLFTSNTFALTSTHMHVASRPNSMPSVRPGKSIRLSFSVLLKHLGGHRWKPHFLAAFENDRAWASRQLDWPPRPGHDHSPDRDVMTAAIAILLLTTTDLVASHTVHATCSGIGAQAFTSRPTA